MVMRKLISEALARDPDIEVVGVAANGSIALQKLTQVNPDVVTLDVEMPDMDGLATLRELRKTHPTLPVIMFSTLTSRGAETTLEALARGATDYVAKPSNMGNVGECVERLRADLIAKIRIHCRRLLVAASTPLPKPMAIASAPHPAIPNVNFGARSRPEIVCIGTSTGGPNALAEVFKNFPANPPVPIVIVQHMPPVFTAMLAERLTTNSRIKFHEGVEGQIIEPGQGYLAPGGKHMEVIRSGGQLRVHLHEGAPENSCRPAVDVLFRSAVKVFGGGVLGVIMTGMGQDGLRGCELIHEQRGQVIVQDEASSVVWGMPGYVASAGYADKVLPLDEIAGEIANRLAVIRPLVSA